MHDVHPLITATTLISADGLIIDKHTGEIHGHDSKPSVFSGVINYQRELGKCRSVDDFQDHLSHFDRRTLPPHELHPLHEQVDYAHGLWRRTGVDCRITIPQLRLLEKLHDLVLYRNVIFMTQAGLAKSLGTAESNLMKKLKVLMDANMLRVSTSRSDNIRKGEIKLSLNPRLVFRGHDKAQGHYIQEWYRPVGSLHTETGAGEHLAIAA
ncbi:replication/maintenance protein RepL [Pseudomonas sp. MWU13-2100]|uniref:replication/maintenance protein RepL n=1 Tax=Pseudomonas sp. MWU13-2100 TaxID=2935075 RepID=UPI00200F1BBD|nr:replication/maintenance protein RepL [Pseudomonas sp. MWU13-2100]